MKTRTIKHKDLIIDIQFYKDSINISCWRDVSKLRAIGSPYEYLGEYDLNV